MCNLLPFGSVWISVIAFGLVYCNAVTLITDLICALFGPYASMFVNRIYPGKSLKTSFVSPGKPWNLVFASPGKSWKTVLYCLYEPLAVKMMCVYMCVYLICQNFCRFSYDDLWCYLQRFCVICVASAVVEDSYCKWLQLQFLMHTSSSFGLPSYSWMWSIFAVAHVA